MTKIIKSILLIFILPGLIISLATCRQNEYNTTELKEEALTKDQEEVKATVERFLAVAGNYNLDAMDEMIIDKNVAGRWCRTLELLAVGGSLNQ